MSKNLKQMVVIAILVIVNFGAGSGLAFAGLGSGKITDIYSIPPFVIVSVETHTSAPSCQNAAFPNEFIFDASTPDGKNMYALVMLAASLGTSTTISGFNGCFWEREVLGWIATGGM